MIPRLLVVFIRQFEIYQWQPWIRHALTSWAFNKPLNSVGLRQLLIFTLTLTRIALNFHLLQKLLKLLLHSLSWSLLQGWRKWGQGERLQSGTKVVDTVVWNGCFYQQFHLLIILFYLICHTSPHPPINVVYSKRKTWGSKIQHWFWGEGVGMFKKGPFYRSVSTLLSLIVVFRQAT